MPTICYETRNFAAETRLVIGQANDIIGEYAAQGFDLTLRQLYYQFVARGLIRNHDREYKRLGSIINDARMAGLIDWDRITDRTRNLRENPHWSSPASILQSAAHSFAYDKWADQDHRVEVWIEKDALVGVLESCCPGLDVPFFSCRGYTSQSEMWGAAQRLYRHMRNGQAPVVIHLGDHDPSGIDMSRDIRQRLNDFIIQDWMNREIRLPEGEATTTVGKIRDSIEERCGAGCRGIEVRRIALTMEQVDEHSPPPNPAKVTDARFANYQANYGDESWELDALDPATLVGLITEEVEGLRDQDRWEAACEREEKAKQRLAELAETWEE